MADVQARATETAQTTLESVRLALAAVEGALEGLRESMEREDLGADVGRATRQARETYAAVRDEAAILAEDESIVKAREAVARGAHAVGEKAALVGERTSAAAHRAGDAAANATDATTARVHDAAESVRAAAESVRRKAAAVGETATRARAAPGRIVRDWATGVKGYAGAMASAVGVFAVAGVLLLTFLVIYAVWQTTALMAWNVLWGPLVSALIFLAAGAAAAAVARSRTVVAAERMEASRRAIREDIDYVKQPMRREFGARRGV